MGGRASRVGLIPAGRVLADLLAVGVHGVGDLVAVGEGVVEGVVEQRVVPVAPRERLQGKRAAN